MPHNDTWSCQPFGQRSNGG